VKKMGSRFVSPLRHQHGFTIGLLAVLALVSCAGFSALFAQSDSTRDVHDTPVPMAAPTQPIPYSHKVHLALGLECQGW